MEFTNHSIFRVLIDARFVLDMFGSRGISECGHGLVDIVICWAQSSDHHCLSVSSQRILQYSSKLGVTIGYICALRIGQTGDNVTKCGQRQVDLRRFLQTLASRTCLALSLGTGKIDNIELTDLNMRLTLVVHLRAFDCNREH